MRKVASETGVKFQIEIESPTFPKRVLLQESSLFTGWIFTEGTKRTVDGNRVLIEPPTIESKFYRGLISPPQILGDFPNIEIVEGVPSAEIPFTIKDPAFPIEELTVRILSLNQRSVPDANVRVTGEGEDRTMNLTSTLDWVGPTVITILVDAPDGMSTSVGFTVSIVESMGFALNLLEWNERAIGFKFSGLEYVFVSANRFSRNGDPGNWFYSRLDDLTGVLGFTYDRDGNDINVYTEVVFLDYSSDLAGAYRYAESIGGVPQNESTGAFDIEAFTPVGATSLSEESFIDLVVGKTFMNPAYFIDSATRFNFNAGTVERGNWKYVKTGDSTATVTLTYDEDNNNASIYREEFLLTFNSLTTGLFMYREFQGTSLTSSFDGDFDLEQGALGGSP